MELDRAAPFPLLFALAIEPVAIWLCQEGGFEGITRAGKVHKLSLYTDDLVLYISNPAASLPVVLSIFDKFGSYSGYKRNKSELLPINSLAKKSTPPPFFPLQICNRRIWIRRGVYYELY